MITAITGTLVRVLDDEVRLLCGALEYQVLVPEFVRRQLQTRVGEELTLRISHYLEGGNMGNRFVPRLIGFGTESELEFFDLLCTVDKIGAKKALKALARPVADIASAIQREDARWLTTLPGLGGATAEQVVTKLKRKVTRWTVGGEGVATAAHPAVGGPLATVVEDTYQALLGVGHGPLDARQKLDAALATGVKFETVEAMLTAIYGAKR